MFIVYYCLRNIQGPHYFPNRGYENLRKINTFSQFRQIFFTLKRDFEQRGSAALAKCLVFEVGFYVEVAVGSELVVPLFAETLDERFFQELIEAHFAFSAYHFGTLTNFPAVVVYGGEGAVFFHPYRVEIA